MASIYTRMGDNGETSLCSGERVSKCCDRVECYGAIDELQAALGMARSLVDDEDVSCAIYEAQTVLVRVMAEIAATGDDPHVTADDVASIERAIDTFYAVLPKGFRWCVPGDSPATAALHVARTVARRSERALLRCMQTEDVRASDELCAYLNRISDLCYVCARALEDGRD